MPQTFFSKYSDYLYSITGFLLLVYFIYHTWHGKYSLAGMFHLERQAEQGQMELKKLVEERQHWENLIAGIDQVIDIDLLEEQARKNGMVIDGDFVYPHTPMIR